MRVRSARFGGTPPPGYILDELFASLTPLVTRLTEVYAAAQTAWTVDSTKAAWIGALNQASAALQNASIDGQLGQQLASGDVTLAQWAPTPENAADLIEYVSQQVGLASYSLPRIWREIVVPTVVDVVNKIPQAVTDWGPLVGLGIGAVALLALTNSARRTFSGYRSRRRKHR